VSRTIPDIGDLLDPVEKATRHKLLPALTGRSAVSDLERELPYQSTWVSTLRIRPRMLPVSTTHLPASLPPGPLIMQQNSSYPHLNDNGAITGKQIKNDQRKEHNDHATTLYQQLPKQMQRAMDCASEKRASSWLPTLPSEHGFALHKRVFREALCLRYGWHPGHLPTKCVWQTVHSRPCFKLSLRWSYIIMPRDQRCYSRPSQ